MMIELEPLVQNRTGRQKDKSARGHETAHYLVESNGEKTEVAANFHSLGIYFSPNLCFCQKNCFNPTNVFE